jgi:hypothetical protein
MVVTGDQVPTRALEVYASVGTVLASSGRRAR